MAEDGREVSAPEALTALNDLDAASVYEAFDKRGALDTDLRPVWAGAKVVGRAFPVYCVPGDNLALHRAVAAGAPGDVLVVEGGGHDCGYWGGTLAVSAQARGIRGLVIDGGVRDVPSIRSLGFPVWARRVSVLSVGKRHAGTIGEPVTCGGIVVRRGDLVIADDDGVVVVAQEAVATVVERARARIAREETWARQLKEGALTLDLLDLRSILREQGVDA